MVNAITTTTTTTFNLEYTNIKSYTQGRCWPNGCPKQDCIVVPPPSNIMEVKKFYRGQNRTLIKYKSK